MSGGKPFGGNRGGISRSGDTRSPGAGGMGVPDARSPGADSVGVTATRAPGPEERCGASVPDTRSPAANGAGVPTTSCRRTQKPGAKDTRPQESRYTAHNLRPAFSLHYDWTGWPTAGTILPPQTATIAREAAFLWEKDGLRLLNPHATTEKVQILFSVIPKVSPTFFCQRVKGRLQHALRKCGTPVDFSRKVSFRSLGENTSEVVENYILGQVGKADFADPRFRKTMRRFTVVSKDVRPAEPSESNSGRYWYNLHLVLVAAER